MAKKTRGLNAAKKLKQRRKKSQELDKWHVQRKYKLREKADPLEGASQGNAIVLEKMSLPIMMKFLSVIFQNF